MSEQLPSFLRDLIACVPPAGTGVHAWLFKVSRQLLAHREPVEVVDLLQAATEGCGRLVPRREIESAVENARACAWQPRGAIAKGHPVSAPPARRWPGLDVKLRASVVSGGFERADLWEDSPIRLDSDGPGTEEIVDTLFPGNPLICVGLRKNHAVTASRESFRGRLAGHQFIVPSPMAALTGKNRDGRESPRCLDNVGPRRFVVAEFDTGTNDEHAAILSHLADFAPLALVVHSGGKSLHGWFRAHQDEEITRRFFEHAVRIGADPATWTRCQFVRMPGGRRDNGAQVVWFFNPGVCQ
ncbi:MAG: hypothetical protein JNK85_29585 [Verrucomicrobiales bacterium]|nr:hypothetical protein [Verrucomicrobiales bacterium]